ncbi:MAG: hypothetical protein P4L79_10805 [Legionella sp.]|uniref:hypothetical protein n=1 Tax=Legionella sp. TaxID=459 RepID=UPI00284DE0E1|nr:hypothetical protein [Legionella sp.]
MLNLLVLLAALTITSISGYVSVIGLTALFSAASSYYVIIALATSLEFAKVAAVSWLHSYWHKSNKLLKTYLILVICLLMVTNSISAFGYLSRAHLETESQLSSTNSVELVTVTSNLKFQVDTLKDLDSQIKQIDDSVNKLMDLKKVNSSISAATTQRKQREVLNVKRMDIQKVIGDLQTKKAVLDNQTKKAELEIGPLKYVAEIIYGSSDPALLEKAVRFVISLIVLVFDPLAVALLVAANSGFKETRLTSDLKDGKVVVINRDNFLEM